MIAKVLSYALLGLEGVPVAVETDISRGLPAFEMVGLPDAAVKESKERVRSAIKNSVLEFPAHKITVNFAPADVKKEGSAFDLPVAVSILAAYGVLRADMKDTVFLGELALNGELRPVSGVLPALISARDKGFQKFIVPKENAKEAGYIRGVKVYAAASLREVTEHLSGLVPLEPVPPSEFSARNNAAEKECDLSFVKGQPVAKRALEVAVAGGHNILFVGPPGSGKTMLARAIPSILPDMTRAESLQTTEIYSVAGMTDPAHPLVDTRPFRSPHHTASTVSLAGGGGTPRPGEISLAHNGVLFLDELPEFDKSALETLRQPLEDGFVTITRAAGTLTLPSRFMLVCAMNPCKCGWYGHPSGRCTCSENQVEQYMRRISGPLLDRIDMYIEVPSVEYEAMRRKDTPESSAVIRQRVNAAREVQKQRFAGTEVSCNAYMTPAMIGRYCQLDGAGERLMQGAFDRLGLTGRSHDRILRMARTIADLEGSEHIEASHLAEAIQFRSSGILK